MDLFILIVIGAVVLAVAVALVLNALGVGEHFLDPAGLVIVGLSRLSRRVNRRRAARRPLPPGVPPPPRSP